MNIKFSRIPDPYSNDVFALMKSGLYPFIKKVYGWDDEFQKRRMSSDYKPEWFHWVLHDGDKIGLVCFKRYDQALHLHLIVVNSKHQSKGFGKKIMDAIHLIAAGENRDVTLSSFKCNERAISFYEKLNYELTEEEKHFKSFRLPYNKIIKMIATR